MRAARDVSYQLYGDPGGTWAMDMNQFLVKMVRSAASCGPHAATRTKPFCPAAAHPDRHTMAPGSVLLHQPRRPPRVQPVAGPRRRHRRT
jgi:hypothetical protein